ncbi:formate dehydrogenase accessory sulfurtransferase FdhD [Thermoproteus tenax]|uniref:Formate dehydrogenase delta subunit n=1 Tax=Thermoproteus tenax (strain ATCC 35583 / DSM 2078 / JCM 9277 / NBRC 100435 / Kra 1) TaxID=768679 RepID=G4RJU4_THETK|nr:formate dehydrogenase accessory sulfurtransferase FdhD [Thermoproteus tenax]CCC81839.1 formate dehydrogenase delta subunit [Thermoproteus tenax Kra 1]
MWREIYGIKVAVDRMIEIYVNDALVATVVATPSELDDLALGFLYAEGYIDALGDVEEVEVRDNKIIAKVKARRTGVHTTLEECGGALSALRRGIVETSISMEQVRALASEFAKFTMPAVEPTLAMHTAAIVNGEWLVAHDVSRHSSALKLVGKALKRGIRGGIVLTTGRASADIVARAYAVGSPVVISIRGPLYSGVEMACKLGVTLVANARGRGFVVFCDRGRIKI